MILILSQEGDTSTSHVIDWLIYYGVEFIRVNEEDRFTLHSFELSNTNFACCLKNIKTDEVLDITKVNVVWYRRGNIIFLEDTNLKTDTADILSFTEKEFKVVHDFIFDYLEKLPHLDSYFRSSMNKLKVLSVAKSVGLLIPGTYIFQGAFPSFLTGTYITKAIFELYKYKTDTDIFFTPTTLLDANDVNKKNIEYSLSQLQDHIEKECDVRIFYLRGRLFSMAIMSQNNEKSKIDFRHYPNDPPNRNFPVKIPKKISNKIVALMKTLNLDSGSLDFILNKEGQFIFLEVNPVGQFGMTSFPCNYYIEREIAKDLILLNKKSIQI